MRVLQVIDALSMGGVETWLMAAIRHWARTGEVETEFLLTGGNPALFDQEAIALGAKLHYISFGRKVLGRFVPRYRALLRDGRFDAIHDHADYASGWHFLMGIGQLPPVRVAHVHNPWLHIEANYSNSRRRKAVAWAGKILVENLATHVLGTSREALNLYGFPQDARRPLTRVLHCGFDVARFAATDDNDRQSVLQEFGWGKDARIVLFAGRLDRALKFDHPQNHKNSWLALNAMRAALGRDPKLRLVMAGAGDVRLEMQGHLRAWGMESQFRLVGVRQDIPRLLRAADLLLFPSRQEGLGMIAVEAQAAGTPVLASDGVPGAARVVPQLYHCENLSAPVSEWALAILRALDAPRMPRDEAAKMVKATDFSIVASAGNLLRIYGSAS